MDSGTPAAAGPGDGIGERRRSELKVYSRRSRGKNNTPETADQTPQPSSLETLIKTTTATAPTDDLHASPAKLPSPPCSFPSPAHSPPAQLDRRAVSDHEASSPNRSNPGVEAEVATVTAPALDCNASSPNCRNPEADAVPEIKTSVPLRNGSVEIKNDELQRQEDREHRRKLLAELFHVRDLLKRLEARQLQVLAVPATGGDGGAHSQLSVNHAPTPVSSKEAPTIFGLASTTPVSFRPQLNISMRPGGSARNSIGESTMEELLVAPILGGGGGAPSQLSVNHATTPVTTKRVPAVFEAISATPASFRPQLSVTVPTRVGSRDNVGGLAMEKEKRTPKANQYLHNSDFILGKDKLPPPTSHKKSKSSKSKKHSQESDYKTSPEKKIYATAFRSCRALLEKLMKHKYGWVFNKPVDAEALGLYDYFQIIKHPMDLGTVKSRLTENLYESPEEFASDVRLTFRNAMAYNPKGQDVHFMAEQLSNFFEERWPVIEAEFTGNLHQLYLVKKKNAPPFDSRRTFERSGSTVQPVVVDLRAVQNQFQHLSRPTALKKPKANDLNKRDMTFREKQTLSRHLQNLPLEKLETVVQIIKKNHPNLIPHDDEIEVDIDSVDADTLWELDRFVTNYKKTLSKHKRKAELAMLARAEAERRNQQMLNGGGDPDQVVAVDPQQANNAAVDQNKVSAPLTVSAAENGDGKSESSGSSRSSSDSGSSDSDSDSESSSSYESDAARSTGT